jgi:hypothetical protein
MDPDSLLHNSCRLYPDTKVVVASALQFDPDAIRRSVPTVCGGGSAQNAAGEQQNATKRRRKAGSVLETYCYPINIALKNQAAMDVLELLINAGPDVLERKDGPDCAGSLVIALHSGRSSAEDLAALVDLMLLRNPAAASVLDRHANSALHVLVRSGGDVRLGAVTRVYEAYPEALRKTNFNGETPLDVATRSHSCPESVVDYLQWLSYERQEGETLENLRDMDELDELYRLADS